MKGWRRLLVMSAVAAAALLLAPPSAAVSAKWITLTSSNFLLVGDVGPKQLRDVAIKLEQFRETLRRLMPDARVSGSIPTVVVVFDTRKGYEPFRPVRQGQPVPVGGLFVGNHDVNYVTFSLEGQTDGYPVIFHEFTHLFARENLRSAPYWLQEGLAEYYSTFELADEGRRAYVGRAVDSHVLLLRRRVTPIPLVDLLDADMSSPVFSNEATRRLFYAQAWVFTHYLLIGNPSRSPQLLAFLRLLSSDVPRADAFRQAFHAEPAEIERELREYVRRFAFRAERITFADRIAVDAAGMQPAALTEAAVQARLGDLLLHMGRVGDAEGRVQSALSLEPGLAAAHVSLGMLRMRQNRIDEGVAEFTRAIALDAGSHQAYYAFGTEVLQHHQQVSTLQMNAARDALERAAALRPDSANTLEGLGRAYLFSGTRLDEAQRVVERAASLAPSEDRHKLTLAQIYLRQRDVVKARAVLGPLVAHGETERMREDARTLLASSAVLEERMLAQPVASPALADAPASGRAPAGLVLSLRPLGAGEQRIEGALERIDCAPGRLTFRLRAGERTLRFTARRLADVDFVTYRNEPMADVRCGARPPGGRVLVSFRPSPAGPRTTASDGAIVALEFVPPGYTLR